MGPISDFTVLKIAAGTVGRCADTYTGQRRGYPKLAGVKWSFKVRHLGFTSPMKTLTIDNVIELATKTPEQAIFDWKSDFTIPNTDEKRGEFLKDLDAFANAITSTYGIITYGVDPRRPDPVVGISECYDDAKLQQLVKGKIEPLPDFLYYELLHGVRTVGVLQIKPTRQRPHIIQVDMGKVPAA
jgi:hypothetical protein